ITFSKIYRSCKSDSDCGNQKCARGRCV
uniref:U18-ctenitoxin-Co1a n=1 Tax=Ctenus ornatus TaxID=406443 RepID=F134_CTEON|nr:RecName: Full=U18-ctenitoxin-Co1a; Short=U18-CNTX-Co1a; AltName: Full=Venom peptide F13-4; Contains: RecName: Full=Venom peptide Oc F7-3 [Oligoctenus ornatus]